MKLQTDRRVEEEIIRRVEQHCNEAKRKRQAFLQQSKKYTDRPETYQMYIDKAEAVDMQYCTRLAEDKATIESFAG